MTTMRTALLAVLGISLSVTAASAADYYIQPVKPGPVQGVPLAVVTLQSGNGGPRAKEAAPAPAVPLVAGKWIRPGEEATSEPATAQPTTAARTSGPRVRPAKSDPVIVDLQAAQVSPWKSVNQLLSSGVVKGGDRIFLMDGYHGPLSVRGYKFTSPVLIAAAPGATAHVDSILSSQASNVIFRDLKVWPLANVSLSAIIRTYGDTSNMGFVNLDIRGSFDAPNYAKWTLTEWKAGLQSAMLIQGNNHTITGNRVTGVRHGILTTGDDTLIDSNIVDGFAGDGMRALGDRSIVRNNKVQNCINLGDGTHRDGFQSYSIGANGKIGSGNVSDIVIENNKIFEWASATVSPLRCQLQGISMFDGTYTNFRVENNVVAVGAYHGITIAGAINTVVRQNTVVSPSGAVSKWPWIRFATTKDGRPSKGSTIVNNFANRVVSVSDSTRGIYVANNAKPGPASSEFVDFNNENLALSASSTAADKGDPSRMSASDIMGVKRFKGKAPDVGAYESR